MLLIRGRRCILLPDFEKKCRHFKSRTFFLRPDFDKNVQDFQTGRFLLFFLKKAMHKGFEVCG